MFQSTIPTPGRAFLCSMMPPPPCFPAGLRQDPDVFTGSWLSHPAPWKLQPSAGLSWKATRLTLRRSSWGRPEESEWAWFSTASSCLPTPPSWTRSAPHVSDPKAGGSVSQWSSVERAGLQTWNPLLLLAGRRHAQPGWGNRGGSRHVWR